MTLLSQIGRMLLLPAAFAVFILAAQSAGSLTVRQETAFQTGAAARAACASEISAPVSTKMCPAPQG
jgi:hypothetical protein